MAEADVKPAYLIAGTDEGKIDTTRRRLRTRAESEGGPGALESFEPVEGRGSPDADAVVAALPAMSLAAGRRYVLADGVEKWNAADTEKVADALAGLPPETTLVLIARGKKPPKLAKAVEAAGGEVLSFDAPRDRDMPRRLVAEAKELGFRLDPDAARLLVDRMGAGSLRLRNELERLALWAAGGEVTAEDLERMVADTSEREIWALSDALIERDAARMLALAERLVSQGEAPARLVYGLASRLRQALEAANALEAGRAPQEVASALPMHPYAAKMLVGRVRNGSAEDLRTASVALAGLETDTRGESDYSDEVALTLTLRRAAGLAA